MKMRERKIRISTIEEAKSFVSKACDCDFDIDVFYNRMIIDAKSILGVLSLDLTKELTVRYDGENGAFEKVLDTYDAARIHHVA